jgi:hypothetical protein
MSARDGDEVYILRVDIDGIEDEKVCIGLLHAKRSDTGELIEMFIEPFEGVLDDLVGDNLLYFERVNAGLYRYSRFEQYPDCEEIPLQADDAVDSTEHAELKAILEEAEKTIRLVQERKPIQKIDPSRTSGPKIENLTKPMRISRLGSGLRHRRET